MNLSTLSAADAVAANSSLVEKCDIEHGSGYERLVVKHNVCYIVAGVVINYDNEVLMIQEAKPSCYGKWYLPAGRMEKNETIVDGVKREVLEEAGIEFEPITVLCVEECGGYWVRIAIVGKMVGGELKSNRNADKESLQAMWWNRTDDIPIRCKDIFPLIELGLEWKSRKMARHDHLLPALQGQNQIFLRILTVQLKDRDFSVLLRTDTVEDSDSLRIPTSRVHPHDRSFYKAMECLLDEALVKHDAATQFKILGVLSIEHSGESESDRDGMGLTTVVELITKDPPRCQDSYRWLKKDNMLDHSLADLLSNSIFNKSMIPLRSLREKF